MKYNRLLTLVGIGWMVSCAPVEIEDTSYTASLSATATSLPEDGGSATLTIALDKANQGDAIPFELGFSGGATLDEDYSVSNETRAIASGSSSASFTLTSTNDSDVEGDEDISITLSFPGNANVTVGNAGSLSFTLTDDDREPPTFTASITSQSTSLAEAGGTATFTVALDKANQGNPLPFQLAFSGTAVADEDFSLSNEAKEIATGSSSTTFTLTGIDDTSVEGDEGITVEVTFPNQPNITVDGDGTVSFTVTDDDTSSADCSGTVDSYSIDLDATNCKESAEQNLGVTSVYSVSVSGDSRIITSNSIPDHNIGMFPNSGNPNSITVQDKTFTITANPTKNNQVTSLTTGTGQPKYWFGILDNSVVLAPIAAEFFTNTSTGEDNMDWNENALSSNISLGTDCNNSHVFPTGRYHHHATPSAYVADRNITGTTPTQIGWAADGYPIYYKYGNKGGSVVELASSFRLKSAERGGDGISAPDGCPDGTYTQDYEYVAGLGDLDECNGYEDPVLGYIYVITDTYPSIPRCFVGTPSDDFLNK